MGLSVRLDGPNGEEIYRAGITHNLVPIATACGLYAPLWRPEEMFIKEAGGLPPLIVKGLATMIEDREALLELQPENGWGTYNGLARFAFEYMMACLDNPEAEVHACR